MKLTREVQQQLANAITRIVGVQTNFVMLTWIEGNGSMFSNITNTRDLATALQDAIDTMKYEREFEIEVPAGTLQ